VPQAYSNDKNWKKRLFAYMDTPILSVVICTYNRNELLAHCLESLIKQNGVSQAWSVIVVNNFCASFPSHIHDLIDQLPEGSSIKVKEPGLSIARNEATQNTQASWMVFLDDDAQVPEDYLSKIFSIIEEGSFDCFGGGIKSWWHYGKPTWLDDTFGSKPDLRTSRGIIKEGYNWGSNIVIRKRALDDVGGFPEYIGMKGAHIGYSAENIVQINLRKNEYRIGYDPALYINHVVAKPKLKMSWHIKAAYATGRDGKSVFPDQYGWKGMLKSVKQCISRPVKGVYKWVSARDYGRQRMYLDCMIPMALFMGKLRSFI
jgi:glycosyltransferase involved in cell wall biosynthesis